MQNPRHVVITGASSGIGESLALAYAAQGIRLGLLGRKQARLEALAHALKEKGAETWIAVVDVTDRAAMAKILMDADDAQPIDLIYANAGISGGTFGKGESEVQARAIFATNVEGVLNTVHPLLPRMTARRKGQIALMASLASFRGFPGAPAYCGSKAAVRLYGEGLRGSAARFGVEVNVICPGYIDTPMTQVNGFPMPFLMKPERCAEIIVEGLKRNKARIAFPWPTYTMAWLLGVLPPSWTDGLLAKLPQKPPLKD
jgi:short-subunit dehydrogenase